MIENIHNTDSNLMLKKELINIASSAGSPLTSQKEELQRSQITQELKQQLHEASSELNKEMKRINTDISFKYNDDIQGLVVTVKDNNGSKILREIPSKEAIELMKKMHSIITGLIFDKKG
ncbi:FlaG family protein [Helicobacter anatolicus]|uniref:FlaG family protein n=1 Tax=Helicobacter anatolicus TaxID=2905874 RepID=UPI0022B922CE|nr:FlaG family protein [Helicobacter anatolicus]